MSPSLWSPETPFTPYSISMVLQDPLKPLPPHLCGTSGHPELPSLRVRGTPGPPSFLSVVPQNPFPCVCGTPGPPLSPSPYLCGPKDPCTSFSISVVLQDPLQPFHPLCGPLRPPSPISVATRDPQNPFPRLCGTSSTHPPGVTHFCLSLPIWAMGITTITEPSPPPRPKPVSPAAVLANSSSRCFGPVLDVAVATMDKNIPTRRRRKQEKAHRGVKTNPTGSGGGCV